MTFLSSVLLADDDVATYFVNTRLLKNLNVASLVLVACNGEEALATLAEYTSY
jgi:response regulator of citrate/malate metabolism